MHMHWLMGRSDPRTSRNPQNFRNPQNAPPASPEATEFLEAPDPPEFREVPGFPNPRNPRGLRKPRNSWNPRIRRICQIPGAPRIRRIRGVPEISGIVRIHGILSTTITFLYRRLMNYHAVSATSRDVAMFCSSVFGNQSRRHNRIRICETKFTIKTPHMFLSIAGIAPQQQMQFIDKLEMSPIRNNVTYHNGPMYIL